MMIDGACDLHLLAAFVVLSMSAVAGVGAGFLKKGTSAG